MTQLKKHQIVMLPTEKAMISSGDLTLHSGPSSLGNPKLLIAKNSTNQLDERLNKEAVAKNWYKSQHLYIISDDEIKEGDYYITDAGIFKCSGYETKRELSLFKKIVATTDKEIYFQPLEMKTWSDSSPYQIPESFIKAYIKAYNEDKPITEVDLEVGCGCNGNPHKMGCPVQDNSYLFPKTRPDNTVIVHPSKLYTREQMLDFGLKCGIAGTLSERSKQDFNQLYLELVQKYL
jgi:hypothetical protein